jgi:hypothetical protein
MALTKLNGVSWSSISKVNGIAKASISKVSGIEATPPPPIQYATLNVTKYGTYINDDATFSGGSWSTTVDAISSDYSYASSLGLSSAVFVGRSFTSYNNARVNLQFDLSSFVGYTILALSLTLNVTGITTNSTNRVFVMSTQGNTFSYPTLNNVDYSLYRQYGEGGVYGTEEITDLVQYNISLTDSLGFANLHPSAFPMTLVTAYDKDTIEPSANTSYQVYFSAPTLNVTYQ